MTRSEKVGLQIARRAARGGWLVQLTGVLDETLDRGRLVDGLDGVVVFDLDAVHRVTSFGVREWIAALANLKVDSYYFVRCRPAVVAQFNMVAHFGRKGQMVTLYAPYLCAACGREFEVLLDLRKDYAVVRSLEPPPQKCPSCGEEAEFDDLPDAYFTYVASLPAPSPPAVAQALIDGSAGDPAESFRVTKEVTEELTALWFSGRWENARRFRRLSEGLQGTVLAVLAGVTDATVVGIAGFRNFALGAGMDLFLAEVPFAVIEGIVADPASWPDLRMVGVRLPFECAECDGVATLSLDGETLGQLSASQTAPWGCATCGGPLTPTFGNDLLKTLRPLVVTDVPASIHRYLRLSWEGVGRGDRVSTTPSGLRDRALLMGKYQIIRQIGAGGMGEVFLARHLGPGGFEKQVVIKRLVPSRRGSKEALTELLEEARLAARLSHPNIVQVFEVGRDDEEHFIVMEYVRGWNLAEAMRLATSLGSHWPIELACRVVSDICAGLNAAHTCVDERGKVSPIIHRDVSPANVLIASEGIVRLTDFGIAKAADTAERTRPGTIKGKFSYMAPEAVQGTGRVDPRMDIFSTGVILHELVSGRRLFRRENEAATLMALLEGDVPPLSAFREADPALQAVADRALAVEPEGRYSSALEMRMDLERCIAQKGKIATANQLADWLTALFGRGAEADLLGADRPSSALPPTSSDIIDAPPSTRRKKGVAGGSDDEG